MADACELLVPSAARMRPVTDGVQEGFVRALAICQRELQVNSVAVHVIDAPDDCIPEWGLGGSTFSPHTIVLAVDPHHDIDPAHVYSTLVHEFHHAMRWRGPGCGTSLGDRLVSEGLAQAFEADCTGEAPLYARGIPVPSHRQLAMAALDEDPANDGRWFFGAADLPRWLGYQLGYELVTKQLPGLHRSAAQLVAEPAATFLDRHR